jgi:hypothetical protein
MSTDRPPPRHPLETRDAARNREEQRRFDLMTISWSEEQLRRACKILDLPEQGRTKDQMQMDLVTSQVHNIARDEMSKDPVTGERFWPDPYGLFSGAF